MTNGDKIRSMTNEELSDFLETITDACYVGKCKYCPVERINNCCDIEAWLKQEADDD